MGHKAEGEGVSRGEGSQFAAAQKKQSVDMFEFATEQGRGDLDMDSTTTCRLGEQAQTLAGETRRKEVMVMFAVTVETGAPATGTTSTQLELEPEANMTKDSKPEEALLSPSPTQYFSASRASLSTWTRPSRAATGTVTAVPSAEC